MIYLGIDGGGTKTRVIIQADDEEPRYSEFPISLKVHKGSYAASAEALKHIISEAAETYRGGASRPLGLSSPLSIALGLSGMSNLKDQEKLKRAIQALPEGREARLHIESDATLTLKSVLAEGEEGILLISGTGSVVFYQPLGGPARRLGGWGPLLSDEGSGYQIGLRALRQYINVLDGIFPRDAFSEAIEARLAAYGVEPIPRSITARAQADVPFVASFAQDAFETAPHLKPIQDLIHEELVNLVTLIFRLFLPGVMSGTMPYRLYLAGRIAQQPMTVRALELAFEEGDVELRMVEEHLPAMKALEIARALEA